MKTVTFDLKGCPGTTPDPIEVPEIQCVAVDEIKSAEAKPGGRTVLVTPYNEGGVCSGQYGQWQVLTGFGGQINRGLYCGDSFEKTDGYSSPGVSSTVDCSDIAERGTKCIAIRDRGRWFVFCPKGDGSGGGGTAMAVGVVLGGNVFLKTLPEDTPELQDPVYRTTYPSPDDTVNEYGSLDTDFPSRRPFAYTLPTVGPDGNALSAPIVNDWRKYDLPEGFALGDKLPRLPDGLCYVQVERPFTLAGGETWESGNTDPPPRPSTGTQAYAKAILDAPGVTVWLKYAVDEGLPAGSSPGATWRLGADLRGSQDPDVVTTKLVLTKGGLPIAIGDRTLGVSAVALDHQGYLSLTLKKFKTGNAPTTATAAEVEAVGNFNVAITSGVVVTSDRDVSVAAKTLGVATGDIRGAVVIGLNDVSRQGFRAGDLVYLIDSPEEYGDRYGLVSPDGNQVRNVYRILGGVSGVKRNITSI